MHLLVRRDVFTENSTTGQLYLDPTDQQRFAYTLEPAWKTDGSKPRAIPPGTFPLTIRWSEKFQRDMPHVEDVPGFDAVEIHWGNFPKDTDACTLVGETRGTDWVGEGNSRDTFKELFQKLTTNPGPHSITYINVDQDPAPCDPEDMA